MYASAIVLKENLIEPENMRNKRPLIVTEILNGVNDDGDQAIIVEGYQQGSKVSLALANENMNDNRGNIQVRNLKAGDVIQYGTNAKGEINVVQLLYRAQTNELSIAGGTDTPNTYWEGGTASPLKRRYTVRRRSLCARGFWISERSTPRRSLTIIHGAQRYAAMG